MMGMCADERENERKEPYIRMRHRTRALGHGRSERGRGGGCSDALRAAAAAVVEIALRLREQPNQPDGQRWERGRGTYMRQMSTKNCFALLMQKPVGKPKYNARV